MQTDRIMQWRSLRPDSVICIEAIFLVGATIALILALDTGSPELLAAPLERLRAFLGAVPFWTAVGLLGLLNLSLLAGILREVDEIDRPAAAPARVTEAAMMVLGVFLLVWFVVRPSAAAFSSWHLTSCPNDRWQLLCHIAEHPVVAWLIGLILWSPSQ